MKAPDKIYIQTYKGETISSRWTTIPFRDFENTEYIRKDALLEWLLKGIEMSKICHSEYGDACAQAYQAVIDKLNSM